MNPEDLAAQINQLLAAESQGVTDQQSDVDLFSLGESVEEHFEELSELEKNEWAESFSGRTGEWIGSQDESRIANLLYQFNRDFGKQLYPTSADNLTGIQQLKRRVFEEAVSQLDTAELVAVFECLDNWSIASEVLRAVNPANLEGPGLLRIADALFKLQNGDMMGGLLSPRLTQLLSRAENDFELVREAVTVWLSRPNANWRAVYPLLAHLFDRPVKGQSTREVEWRDELEIELRSVSRPDMRKLWLSMARFPKTGRGNTLSDKHRCILERTPDIPAREYLQLAIQLIKMDVNDQPGQVWASVQTLLASSFQFLDDNEQVALSVQVADLYWHVLLETGRCSSYCRRPLPHLSYIYLPASHARKLDQCLQVFMKEDREGDRPNIEALKLLRDWLVVNYQQVLVTRLSFSGLFPLTSDLLEKIYFEGSRRWIFRLLSDPHPAIRAVAASLWVDPGKESSYVPWSTVSAVNSGRAKAAAFQLAADCPFPGAVIPILLKVASRYPKTSQEIVGTLIGYFAQNMPGETDRVTRRIMKEFGRGPSQSRLSPGELSEIAQFVSSRIDSERNVRGQQADLPELQSGSEFQDAWYFFHRMQNQFRNAKSHKSTLRQVMGTIGVVRGSEIRNWQKTQEGWEVTGERQMAEFSESVEVPKESVVDRLSEAQRRRRWKVRVEEILEEKRDA